MGHGEPPRTNLARPPSAPLYWHAGLRRRSRSCPRHPSWLERQPSHHGRSSRRRPALAIAEPLFHPGEVILGANERFVTSWAYATLSSRGLGKASRRFHAAARRIAPWPGGAMPPRPVTLNTWEGNYFDHDVDSLRAQATAAARIGVERFVLDDGWFGRRDDDTSSLGDWLSIGASIRTGYHLDRACPWSRHGVRSVGRARNGESRFRPLPRASELGAPGCQGVRSTRGATSLFSILRGGRLRTNLFARPSRLLSGHPIDY